MNVEGAVHTTHQLSVRKIEIASCEISATRSFAGHKSAVLQLSERDWSTEKDMEATI